MRFPRSFALAVLSVPAVFHPPLAAQQEPERVVRKLEFVGNHAIDGYTLGTVIATTKSSWFATSWLVRWLGLGAKRYFDELEFRRDVVRLILYYRQSGYMQAVVDTSVRRTPRDAYVTFRIFEGQPVRVRRLDLEGITGIVGNQRALRRALPLKVGDPFNRFLMQASADTMAAWLRNRGFPYAEVLRNFDAEAAELQADIRFEAVPGPYMRIGQVVVEGVQRADTGTVLHALSVHSGAPYREDQLYQSQRDLYGVGMFRAASVSLRDTAPPADGDSTVDVLVRVAEGPRQRVGLGAGYGTLDCFRAQGGWSSYGFLGDARVLNLSARLSKLGVGAPLDWGFRRTVCFPLHDDRPYSDTVNYNVALTLLQPTFLSPSHSASIGVFAERRSEFETYTRIQVGSNVGVTFNARRRVPLTLVYGYSLGRTEATDANFCSVFNVCDDSTLRSLRDPHPFASLTLTAALRTEDFTLDPSRGGHVGITLLHSSRLLGSDRLYEFNRGEMEVARYIPFGRYGVLAWRVHAGALFPARITFSPGQSALFVPPDQRFYAGGPNSVRGYAANGLGPQVYVVNDTTVTDTTIINGDTIYNQARRVATGGNSLFIANAEVRVRSPVWPDRVRLAAFVDVGQVYRDQNELFSFRSLRITPGAGVRVTTPLGPVRVDVAYNGYDFESGVLKLQSGGTLTDYRPRYQPKRTGGFFRRLTLQFAIGQAF